MTVEDYQGQREPSSSPSSEEAVAVLFSGEELLHLARRACERSKTDPSEAITAVVLSVIAFEAFFNEMTELASSQHLTEKDPEEIKALGGILSDLEHQRARIDLKLQIAHFILKGSTLDKGELPYQDFDLLVKIRNSLVHTKPEKWTWVPDEVFEPHKLVRHLSDRHIIPTPPPDEPPLLFTQICCAEVAIWAYNTVADMIVLLIDIVPDSTAKELLSRYEIFEPI